ncbi:MAG: hypothetical protein LIQ30_08405, partial [Planctomycetes bacterium]|nr:hypothetical protein [Planctomycetota bacterium]
MDVVDFVFRHIEEKGEFPGAGGDGHRVGDGLFASEIDGKDDHFDIVEAFLFVEIEFDAEVVVYAVFTDNAENDRSVKQVYEVGTERLDALLL